MAVYNYELSPFAVRDHYQIIVPPVAGSAGFIKNVGVASSKTTGTALAVTVPVGGVSAGSTLIVKVAHDFTSGGPTVADSRGNTYTRDRTAADSGTTIRASIFSCAVGTSLVSGDTITVTFPASIAVRAAAIDEFASVLTPIAVDAQDGLAGTSATPGMPLVTVNANDLLIGMVSVAGDSVDAYTEDSANLWTGLTRIGTTGGTATANRTINTAYRSVGAAGTYHYAPTLGTSSLWVEFMVAYKAT